MLTEIVKTILLNCSLDDRDILKYNVPVIQLELPKLDAYHLGYLIYFFMKACAMSACLLEVNPFDQPGVEAYKRKMLELLREGEVVK